MAVSEKGIVFAIVDRIFDIRTGIITPKKVMMLLYLIVAIHYASTKKHLQNTEISFEAWDIGPINPTAHEMMLKRYSLNENIYTRKRIPRIFIELTPYEDEIIEEVFNIFNKMSATQLQTYIMSHKPWREQRIELHPWNLSHNKLSYNTIYEEYSNMMCKNDLSILKIDEVSKQ